MSALLFGSISTLADTSELQRAAFNQAFAASGLEWEWTQDDYRAMLATSGGKDRVAEYADARGETVDAAAVHALKSSIFRESLATAEVEPRAGVVETIRSAKERGWTVGLVTTTSPENVQQLLEALSPTVTASDFDLVTDSSSGLPGKPDSAVYTFAVDGTEGSVVVIEDNVGGVTAAAGAGLSVVAFPNVNTAGHDFGADVPVVDHLDPATLLGGAA